MQPRDDLLPFVVEKSSENGKARRFLENYALPDEIPLLVRKIFTAIALGNVAEMFAGQICIDRLLSTGKLALVQGAGEREHGRGLRKILAGDHLGRIEQPKEEGES